MLFFNRILVVGGPVWNHSVSEKKGFSGLNQVEVCNDLDINANKKIR